jgi:hypothetical protein
LRLRGNTERFALLPDVQLNNNTKESYCVYMARIGTRTRHNVTLYVHYLSSCVYSRKIPQGHFCPVVCHPKSPPQPFVYHFTDWQWTHYRPHLWGM